MKEQVIRKSRFKLPQKIGYTYILLSFILLLFIIFAILNTTVCLKYEPDGAIYVYHKGNEAAVNLESWIRTNITTLKIFGGYVTLSIIIAYILIRRN